jgi:hypothetical protein
MKRILFLLSTCALVLSSCSSRTGAFPIGAFKTIGLRSLEFFEDGTYIWGFVGTPLVQGQYDVDGQTITFHSETKVNVDQREEACPGEGSYTWVFEDNVLTMELVLDDCDDRIADTDGIEHFLIEP